MVAPQRVESAVYDETDQLLAQRNPTSQSLSLCHPRTDIHVTHNLTTGAIENEREYVGRLIVPFMLGIEATHGVAAEKGDRNESLLAFLVQYGLDHTLHQRARERKPAPLNHDLTHARPTGIPVRFRRSRGDSRSVCGRCRT